MQGENTEYTEILREAAWRLNAAAEEADISQAAIASRLGASPSRVGNWFQGLNLPRKRERAQLAEILGVTESWLFEAGTEKRPSSVSEPSTEYTAVRHVPVISWSHAGSAATYEELPKHWQGQAPTSSTDRRAFALVVEGDCMEPKAMPGDRVILEPGREPRNGHAVVAKLVDDAVQLRIYTKLPNGLIRLASMKPEIYPTIEYKASAFHWIYPVKELVRTL